jgi:hypothetical protein
MGSNPTVTDNTANEDTNSQIFSAGPSNQFTDLRALLAAVLSRVRRACCSCRVNNWCSVLPLAWLREIVMADFKRQNTLRTPVTVMLSLFLLASESAGAQGVVLPLPPDDQEMIAAQLGPIVGRALPSMPIEDVSTYFPLQEKASIYQATAGRDTGKTQTLGLAKVRRPNGEFAWRFQFSPSLAGFIRQTPEGDLIMPAVGDTGDAVVVVTTPASPFVVKGMKPGETRYYVQQVVVDALDEPADQEYSGSLNGSYTYLGAYQDSARRDLRSGPVPSQVRRQGRSGPNT